MGLFAVVKVHESTYSGRVGNRTEEVLCIFETPEKAQKYIKENNLTFRGNSTGSVSYSVLPCSNEV